MKFEPFSFKYFSHKYTKFLTNPSLSFFPVIKGSLIQVIFPHLHFFPLGAKISWYRLVLKIYYKKSFIILFSSSKFYRFSSYFRTTVSIFSLIFFSNLHFYLNFVIAFFMIWDFKDLLASFSLEILPSLSKYYSLKLDT